ncbi:hypothetical protein CBS101457_004166 [Exobasidium rhododendri]|nr:hypothetical protein CBS101457_004166 [Exobasidium rhododendri]
MHIVNLLRHVLHIERISVGFLDWSPAPPRKKMAIVKDDLDNEEVKEASQVRGLGTGEDSFERGQLGESRHGPSQYDDRLTQCREIYSRALPEALSKSQRKDCTVAILRLPFVESSPMGFADWILSHHASHNDIRSVDTAKFKGSWSKRDLSKLPTGVAEDGAPSRLIWDTEPSLEWSFDGRSIKLLQGKDSPWMIY